jgi:mRNA interferase MazF
MIKFEFGHIVLLRFPFTDSQSVKKRPALVIKEFPDGDVLVCRITSQLYDSDFDIQVESWQDCGLLLPSVIRVHKVACLQHEIIEKLIGRIKKSDKEQVIRKFLKLLP